MGLLKVREKSGVLALPSRDLLSKVLKRNLTPVWLDLLLCSQLVPTFEQLNPKFLWLSQIVVK